MIRQSSIGLGELIAVANPVLRPTTIIEGLNGVSHGLHPYTEQFRKEIVEATSGDETEHTAVMEAASSRLAEIIRGAMENISAYGKPLAMAIGKEAEVCYSRQMLRSVASVNFKHQFIWLDDPFFDSPIYPKEVKDKSLFTYTNVGLESLEGLQFEFPTNEQVLEFVNSNHADVVEIMRERDSSPANAAFCLTDKEALDHWFARSREGNYDFSRIKQLDSEKLLKAYIILTKMYSSDNPVPWLKSGSLEAYRQFVTTLWNGMTVHLINLKVVVANYRDAKMVVVDNGPVRLVDGRGDTQKDVRFLEADTMVYYTDEVLEAITSKDCSMAEVVMGYYWERLTGNRRTATEMFTNPEHFQAKANEYFAYVNEKLSAHAEVRFIAGGLKTIHDFIIGNENIMSRLDEIRAGSQDLLGTWVSNTFGQELRRCYAELMASGYDFGSDVPVSEGDERPGVCDVVMSSHIVPVFLRALGCGLAADLLEDTFITQAGEDNVSDQRQRLTVSVINLIVDKCLE